MAKQLKSPALSNEEKSDLIVSIKSFATWIVKKQIVERVEEIDHTVDMPFSKDDWVMVVDQERKSISFNALLRERCSAEYYRSIVLHEYFHLVVQRVPNKSDAIRVKDDFGEQLMKLIDIEADFFTALYQKEELNYSIIGYLKLYFEGGRAFSDPWIRVGKLERYIGTILSICKMFINHPLKKSVVKSYDLYLPCITPLYTENSLHVLVLRKEHIYFDLILASQDDFVKIKECYRNIDSMTRKGYTEKVVEFACKALALSLPNKVKQELEKIEN